jgi:hypothetical protein
MKKVFPQIVHFVNSIVKKKSSLIARIPSRKEKFV